MEHQSLSYGIFALNNLKLTVLNDQNEQEEKVFEIDDDLDVYELIEEHNPKFILFQEDAQEEIKEKFLNLVPLEGFDEAILKQTQNFGSFKNYVDKSFANWCLTNNLYYIENLTSYTKELIALWSSDRKKFSLEFWKFLRSNLGTSNLSVLFNDVDEKDRLSLAKFQGEITPTFSFATEAENETYDFFKTSLIEEETNFLFDKEKKQFHLFNQIGTGPVLAWGELENISVLQKTLIQGVFNALNAELAASKPTK